MKLLLFEPSFSGHRLNFARFLIEALHPHADRLTLVTSPGALESAAYQEQLAPIADRFEVDPAAEPAAGKPAKRAWATARALVEAVERHQPDRYYVPYVDGISQCLAVMRLLGRAGPLRRIPGEGLLMRGGNAYPSIRGRRRLQARLSLALHRVAPWRIVHLLDPLEYEYVMQRGGRFAKRCRLLPEPVEPMPQLSTTQARQTLGLNPKGRYIGCAGGMDTRKGIDLLIRAYMQGQRQPGDRLLLAGRLAPPVRELIDNQAAPWVEDGRIILLDRYISDDEFAQVIGASAVVAATYPRHIGSSGVVVRAVAMGRPVVGSSFGWIGDTINRFALGRAVNVRDISTLAAAIDQGLDTAGGYQPSPAAQRLAQFHTVANFCDAWRADLLRDQGQAPSQSAPTWKWVTEPIRQSHS